MSDYATPDVSVKKGMSVVESVSFFETLINILQILLDLCSNKS